MDDALNDLWGGEGRDVSMYVQDQDKELAGMLKALQRPWASTSLPSDDPLQGYLWRK